MRCWRKRRATVPRTSSRRPRRGIGRSWRWRTRTDGSHASAWTWPSFRRGRRRRRAPATRRRCAKDGSFFYLVGGDPGIVPDVLAGSPVWQAIIEAWVGGAALAGSSAGAMALGRWTLTRRAVPGDRDRRYREALGLVPNVAVLPHFATFGREWVTSALDGRPSDDVILLGVDERAAAVWSGGSWRAMGDGGVTVDHDRGGAHVRGRRPHRRSPGARRSLRRSG